MWCHWERLFHEAKWARMLPHVWIPSCTQGGYTTREQLSTYTLSKKQQWQSGCFTAGGCSSGGTTVSKYQRKSKTRVTVWTLFKTQRPRRRGYAILFTLTHQQRLGVQQLNACTTGEDIRPDLRIKAIKKKLIFSSAADEEEGNNKRLKWHDWCWARPSFLQGEGKSQWKGTRGKLPPGTRGCSVWNPLGHEVLPGCRLF